MSPSFILLRSEPPSPELSFVGADTWCESCVSPRRRREWRLLLAHSRRVLLAHTPSRASQTSKAMGAYFKQHATAKDLRDVQANVAWEWAVATGLPIPEAAKKFCKEYRSFWPLTQLGDPLKPDDRMFSIDEREVLTILRKLEEKYGKVSSRASRAVSPALKCFPVHLRQRDNDLACPRPAVRHRLLDRRLRQYLSEGPVCARRAGAGLGAEHARPARSRRGDPPEVWRALRPVAVTGHPHDRLLRSPFGARCPVQP